VYWRRGFCGCRLGHFIGDTGAPPTSYIVVRLTYRFPPGFERSRVCCLLPSFYRLWVVSTLSTHPIPLSSIRSNQMTSKWPPISPGLTSYDFRHLFRHPASDGSSPLPSPTCFQSAPPFEDDLDMPVANASDVTVTSTPSL
jgi:hypothetical protein